MKPFQLHHYTLFLAICYLFEPVSSLLAPSSKTRYILANTSPRIWKCRPIISLRMAASEDAIGIASQRKGEVSAKENDIDETRTMGAKGVASSSPEGADILFVSGAAVDNLKGSSQFTDQRRLWEKRLITPDDPFNVHKISGLLYTISSAILLGTAIIRLVDSPESFAVIPDFLGPVSSVFVLSNVCLCLASIRMASLHRRNDIASRNGFFGAASSSLFSCYFFIWTGPFAPEAFNDPFVSGIFFGIVSLFNIVFVFDTIIRTSDVMEARRGDNEEENKGRYSLDFIRYILPPVVFLPVVAATWYISGIAHDRAWFLQQCDWVMEETGYAFQASVYYNNVLGSNAAAYAALLVTLRDKKLISKTGEWVGIAIFAIPSLIWTIDVTLRFLPAWVR